MEEIWKDIEGCRNHQVSSLGRIINTKFNRYLTVSTGAYGYQTVSLSCNGISKTSKVRILVAKAFIENPKNKNTN